MIIQPSGLKKQAGLGDDMRNPLGIDKNKYITRRPIKHMPLNYSTIEPSEESKELVKQFDERTSDRIDWVKVKTDFINGLSVPCIVHKYRIPERILTKKIQDENWLVSRTKVQRNKRKDYEDFDEYTRLDIAERVLSGEQKFKVADKFRTTLKVVDRIVEEGLNQRPGV